MNVAEYETFKNFTLLIEALLFKSNQILYYRVVNGPTSFGPNPDQN